jgi:chromosome segregation protein
VAESEQELEGLRTNLDSLETQQKSARDRAAVILQKLNEDRQAYADRQARFDQIEGRRQQLADESEEIVSELSRTGSELDEARRHFAIAEDETGALERQREALLTEKEALTRKLSEARVQAQAAQDRRHEAELALQHSQASLESHRSSLSRLQAQSSRMQQRYEQLSQQLSTGEDPGVAMGDRLQILLTQRSEAEQALAEGRNRHSTIEQEIRQVQGALSECEQEVASARENLESKRLKDQELAVRLQTLEEQIAHDEYVLSHILENLPQEAEEAEWTTRSERLAQKIANIGPVNLVAIEEFEEQAERKEYLDSQHADLIEALETLSGVIRKIDRETRDRFKSTFDSLNQGFSDFFPQLFGGGNAVLQLTEEDLLAAGVTVMARPPGKRNSTINLLSGGEKALTAVALLFALFKLNPAPFCILDEVDAPLDDRNVERYCKTLRTLSEVSQLVVITHNKITMESADILLGVTMGEPGVSSIVSVDIDEAVRLAAQ